MSETPVDAPDYGAYAEDYARARPSYPDELFAWLASLVPTGSAWDCGTGSGQAARGLAAHFTRVIATDRSPRQIEQARPVPNVEYRVGRAEDSGLGDRSVDLVTAATAMHWFDLPSFYREARRVLRPGGVLAVWSYHGCIIEPPFTELFARFYRETLRPHFPDEVNLVDDRYGGIDLPGANIEAPALWLEGPWTKTALLDFMESWSGVRGYHAQHGRNAVATIRAEFDGLWGDPGERRELRWPLFVRAARL